MRRSDLHRLLLWRAPREAPGCLRPATFAPASGRARSCASGLAGYGLPSGPIAGRCAQVPETWRVRGREIRIVDQGFLNAAHARSIPVHVWTIDDRAAMERLLDLGVDGIMTDRPAVLRELLEDPGRVGDDRLALSIRGPRRFWANLCSRPQRYRSAAGNIWRCSEGPARTHCPQLKGPRSARFRVVEIKMTYDDAFKAAIGVVKAEGRYRSFAHIERRQGSFPHALPPYARRHQGDRGLVLERLSRHGAAPACSGGDARSPRPGRRRVRRHTKHFRDQPLSRHAGSRAGGSSPEGIGAPLQ